MIKGNNKQPKLWREIRQIIFSFIDGSELPTGYGNMKEKIVLNNPKSIVAKKEITLSSIQEKLNPEDTPEGLFDFTESKEDQVGNENTFFGNFIKYIQKQISKILQKF